MTPRPRHPPLRRSGTAPLCPRLADFRDSNRTAFPDWHNAPVDLFPAPTDNPPARLLIVGLAPGLRGANRTGRPFTGDYAGDLLYATLSQIRPVAGNLRGPARRRPRNWSAARSPTRCAACRPRTSRSAPRSTPAAPSWPPRSPPCPILRAILALGTVAHGSVLAALG